MKAADRVGLSAEVADWFDRTAAADRCLILLAVEVVSVIGALPEIPIPGVEATVAGSVSRLPVAE